MSYNNLSVQVTSTTGTWNGSSFSYSTIALDSGIPDIDQIEVERIFDLTTITTDTSGAALPAIASNITTVDLRKIYLLDKTNYTLNQTTHAITGFSITSTSKTFTFTGTGALNGKIIYIPPVTNGQQLTVRRKTYSLGAYVTWVAGTRLTSEQLNGQVTQLVKIIQELLYKLDSEFVKKTDFLATDAASLEASANINMANNYVVGLNPAGTYVTGYAVPMDYVNNMGFRHGVITNDIVPSDWQTDINPTSSSEGRSGIWFDPEDGRLKVWAGNAWVVATAASRGPGVVQLTGTQSISGAKTFLNTVAMDQAATIAGNLTVDTNTLHVDASTNRVGIGITSPTRKLHLHESTAATNNYISITNSTTGTTSTDGLILGINTLNEGVLWTFENTPLVFGTNNTERVRITATGNVGIGTASPSTALQVNGIIKNTNPAFYAIPSQAAPDVGSTPTLYTYWNDVTDIGSNMGSTYFVAPVTGLYCFSVCMMFATLTHAYPGTLNYGYTQIRKYSSGDTYLVGSNLFHSPNSSTSAYWSVSGTWITPVTAGEKIAVAYAGKQYGISYDSFCGYLIG